ncbi:MAG: hypothetical protein NTY19_26015 [Planctomycetota bacterium]|nr:hypothetical protein [Planctomycetota bacterium]
MSLTREECPLVTDELFTTFQRLEQQLGAVQEKLSNLWQALVKEHETEEEEARKASRSGRSRDKPQSLRARFELLRAEVTKKTYRVGFIGRSQVGKSTTVNNVLGVRRDDVPGPPSTGGVGVAATSTPTKVHRVEPGQPATCSLRFRSSKEHREWRDALCIHVGVDPENSDAALIAKLNALLAQPCDSVTTTHFRRYLLRFLSSALKFGDSLVKEEPLTELGDYEKRAHYTNHAEGADANKYQLLREVNLGFPSNHIDQKLEIIDLPGLGAGGDIDDILTQQYLPVLHGALVFQSSEHVGSAEAYKLLDLLRRQWRELRGRAWMVVTRFDSIGGPQIHGEALNHRTILDSIGDTLRQHQLAPEQVMLVGNGIYEKLLDLGKSQNECDEEDIPERFRQHAHLADQYLEVLKDGGISNIRHAVGHRLAQMVEREVQENVRREIRELTNDLVSRVETAKRQAQMSRKEFGLARRWRQQVRNLANQLDNDRSILETPAVKLRTGLREVLDEHCPPDNLPAKDDIPRDHAHDMPHMIDTAQERVATEILPELLRDIRRRLETAASQQNLDLQLAMPGGQSPLERWDKLCAPDLADESWYSSPLSSFKNPPLFPDDPEQVRDFLAPREYRDMMEHKVHAVACQTIQIIYNRLKQRLEGLGIELSSLGDDEHVDRVQDVTTFDSIVQLLREIPL